MSTERKNNTLKRDQALNDATNGQLGEEPRQVPLPGSSKSESDNITDSLRRTARKMSRDNCIKNYLSTFNSFVFSSIKRKSKIDFMFVIS
jgi:hypothetical protein